jgi:hypothetical protein
VIRKTHAVFASQLFAFITLAVPFAGEAASRDAAVGSGEDAPQEIVVTSQKRAEDIKDIPFSVRRCGPARWRVIGRFADSSIN